MKGEWKEIAKSLMKLIQYDNGAVNRIEKEKYPIYWINKIAPIAGKFFDTHPELLREEVIEDIAIGEWDENQENYGKLDGYKELDNVLNKYFESI